MVPRIFAKRPSAAQRYVDVIMRDPKDETVAWLAATAADGDVDRSRWELRYLTRALGLFVAQRDAMDDRTSSQVARHLAEAMQADRLVAAPMLRLAERQFNERLSAYREMLGLRGGTESPGERVGRTMLMLTGAARIGAEDAAQAADLVETLLLEASTALRTAFGEARLPAAGPG